MTRPCATAPEWPRHRHGADDSLMAKAAPGVGFAITMSTTYAPSEFLVAQFFAAFWA